MENSNNFQGKTPESYSNSAKFAAYSIAFIIVTLILMTLLGGCSTTKKVDSCCSSKTVVE